MVTITLRVDKRLRTMNVIYFFENIILVVFFSLSLVFTVLLLVVPLSYLIFFEMLDWLIYFFILIPIFLGGAYILDKKEGGEKK